MKLAYPVGTPETKGAMLAYRGEFAQVCESLHALGYDGVELFVRDPRAIDWRTLRNSLQKNSLQVAAVGTGPMVAEDRLSFTSLDKTIRQAAIERIKQTVDFAANFGAPVIIGKLRGNFQPEYQALSEQWMQEAFLSVCEYAQRKITNIIIEPQSRFDVNNLNTARQALEFIQNLKVSNLYIMLDSFHMNIEEASMIVPLIMAREKNIHMHFADNNRGIPGTGHIDFYDLARILKVLQYNHYISLEIAQTPDCFEAAKKSFQYLHPLLHEMD